MARSENIRVVQYANPSADAPMDPGPGDGCADRKARVIRRASTGITGASRLRAWTSKLSPRL